MSMMPHSVLYPMVDGILILLFLSRTFSFGKWVKRRGLTLLLSCLVQGALIFAAHALIPPPFDRAAGMLAALLYGVLLLEGQLYVKLISVLLFITCVIMSDCARFYAFKLWFDAPESVPVLWHLLWNALWVGINVAIFFLLSSQHFHLTAKIPRSFQGILTVEVVLCLFIMGATVGLESAPLHQVPEFLLVLIVCVFMAILLLYYLFARLTNEYEENLRIRMSNARLSMQKKHLEETTQMYENIRVAQHELKNQIFYMDTLLRRKEYDDLEGYFSRVYKKDYGFSIVESGNDLLNALLSQKSAYAHARGVPLRIQAALPDRLEIHDDDLCALLSNLLDNAIEACAPLESPLITLELSMVKNYLVVVCRNTVRENVLKLNPQLKTTKKNQAIHGIGLRVVRDIVRQYDGMLEHRVDDGMFVAELMLKNQMDEKVSAR